MCRGEQPDKAGNYRSGNGGSTMKKRLDEKVIPPAAGKRTTKTDFDRNRDGLYGGLPKARDPNAAGPRANAPHPERDAPSQTRERKPPRR